MEDIKMKKGTTPELNALSVKETANGFFNSEIELCFIANDNKKPCTPNPEKPDSPEELHS